MRVASVLHYSFTFHPHYMLLCYFYRSHIEQNLLGFFFIFLFICTQLEPKKKINSTLVLFHLLHAWKRNRQKKKQNQTIWFYISNFSLMSSCYSLAKNKSTQTVNKIEDKMLDRQAIHYLKMLDSNSKGVINTLLSTNHRLDIIMTWISKEKLIGNVIIFPQRENLMVWTIF